MSYSNKIFNVNGVSEEALLSCLKIALSDSSIYGYHIDNKNGLEVMLSKSLMPFDDSTILYESPSSLEDEFPIILKYLQNLKEVVEYNDEDDTINLDLAISDSFQYKNGWRVYVKLQEKNSNKWWNHSVWVRPSYVLESI